MAISSNGAEGTRVETGKQTIPAYSTLSGNLTTTGIPNVLAYTGALTAQNVFGADLQKGAVENNLYVYESTSTHGSVRKIKAVFTPDSGATWSILVDSAFTAPLVGEILKIVTANLQDYSLTNASDTDGYYDGVVLSAGQSIERRENTARRQATRNREAKAIDATGTSFFIEEDK